MLPTPLRSHARGITISIKLTPKAKREEIGGLIPGEDNTMLLKATVTAPPEDSKANKALIALLAKEWGLPKSAFSLLAGETSRQKVILVEGETAALMERLSGWLQAT